jgi:hypothetical protein
MSMMKRSMMEGRRVEQEKRRYLLRHLHTMHQFVIRRGLRRE